MYYCILLSIERNNRSNNRESSEWILADDMEMKITCIRIRCARRVEFELFLSLSNAHTRALIRPQRRNENAFNGMKFEGPLPPKSLSFQL